MNDNENARRAILEQTIGSVWTHGWTRRRIDAYSLAIRSYPPDAVQAGCEKAIREWRGDYAPAPAKLREYIDATRRRIDPRRDDDTEYEPIDLETWRARAIAGDYGDVIAALAAQGATPADVQHATTQRLTQAAQRG